jgi:hypothetical protein
VNQSTLLFGADFVPLGLGAWFSPQKNLDLGVTFSDDLKHAGDRYVITFGGRYYIQ